MTHTIYTSKKRRGRRNTKNQTPRLYQITHNKNIIPAEKRRRDPPQKYRHTLSTSYDRIRTRMENTSHNSITTTR